LFRAALAAATAAEGSRAASLVAFGQQHLGKCLYDQGRDEEALACFEQALAIRRAVQVPADQLASSEQAVRAARHRLAVDATVSGPRSTPS
jgi:tetratricopeptide (TPR) repeat protein